MQAVKITECPRDAMQGISAFIPTAQKVRYHNALLKVGFDTLDFGSFVSPKAIPQLQDTTAVVEQLDTGHSTKLLAIVGNMRGAETAFQYPAITYLGYPFSISSTFLQRNLHTTLEASFAMVRELLQRCSEEGKQLVTYISMAFGNPYGDDWDQELLLHWIAQLHQAGARHISLADTYGLATPDAIGSVIEMALPAFEEVHFSLHLHTTAELWYQKVDAAYQQGCRHFEGVLSGLGGCPMAGPKLVGNLRTTDLLDYFLQNNIPLNLNMDALKEAEEIAAQIMPLENL